MSDVNRSNVLAEPAEDIVRLVVPAGPVVASILAPQDPSQP